MKNWTDEEFEECVNYTSMANFLFENSLGPYETNQGEEE